MMHATVTFFLFLVLTVSAAAHTRSQSASDWRVEGVRLEGSFSIDARRATLLYGLSEDEGLNLDAALADHLARKVHVSQEGAPCEAVGAPMPQPAATGYLRARLIFECPEDIAGNGADLDIGAFFDLSATHLHIIRVRDGDDLVLERVLTGPDHQAHVGPEVEISLGERLGSFIKAGISHVLSGWDHLAFLAALLLLAGRVRPIIATITGFTLGHSLTMALVALGVLRPYGLAVEVLIGFSIAYAAMEAGAQVLAPQRKLILWVGVAVASAGIAILTWLMGQAWPPVIAMLAMSWFVLSQSPAGAVRDGWSWRAPALATLFGLAHGAGFAGALLEYHLSGQGLLWSLLGFNLGVELGQLTAVAVILVLVAAVQRASRHSIFVYRLPLAAGLFGLGIFWTVGRLALVG